jgi:signal transduction histidine kinase
VICHELRNPLNGIYHNADIVNESMRAVQIEVLKFRDELLRLHSTTDLSSIAYTPGDSEAVAHLFDFIVTELSQNLESLESLNLCAKHQKRIADDVLQMSKLSMNLVSLSITPFDPLVETSNVIRMFEREAFVKKIAFKFKIGPGFAVLGVSWVNADPIRFSQVLLNFISNAVRFTEKSPQREIEIRLDASIDEPEFPSSLTASQFANPHVSGRANIDELQDRIFLIVTVADTGVGLTAEERSNLFQKFAQASPRTHIEYGGSGLGLFISKSLVEVQGGRIALESEKGKGTTLTFYIQAEKVASPGGPLVSPTNNAPRLAINSRSSSPFRIKTPRLGYNRTSSPGLKRLSVLVVEDNLVYPTFCATTDWRSIKRF